MRILFRLIPNEFLNRAGVIIEQEQLAGVVFGEADNADGRIHQLVWLPDFLRGLTRFDSPDPSRFPVAENVRAIELRKSFAAINEAAGD